MLSLKDLLATLFSPKRATGTFSGFARRPKDGKGNLLIPQWLLAKLLRRTGGRLLSFKGLGSNGVSADHSSQSRYVQH